MAEIAPLIPVVLYVLKQCFILNFPPIPKKV